MKLKKVVLKVAWNDEISKSSNQGGLKWWNRQKLYSRWFEIVKLIKVVLKVTWNVEIDKSPTQGGWK